MIDKVKELRKSKRHSKIAGDWGEATTMYWLSKRDFESIHVDYTGIDIIAYDNRIKRRLGISVKARTRAAGAERDSITVKSKEIPKIKDACNKFAALPYISCVVDKDAENTIEIYIVPLKDILEINEYDEKDNKDLQIKFNKEQIEKYEKLNDKIIIKFKYEE